MGRFGGTCVNILVSIAGSSRVEPIRPFFVLMAWRWGVELAWAWRMLEYKI